MEEEEEHKGREAEQEAENDLHRAVRGSGGEVEDREGNMAD